MGASLQWREPPDREARAFGRMIEFGGRTERASGYLSYSERIGPGVLVCLGEDGDPSSYEGLAHALTAEGFTVLVVGSDGAAAAASHLRDNWHPRLGLIALPGATGALADIEGLDAIVAYGAELDAAVPAAVDLEFDDLVDFLHYNLS
jgi:hypothetical protein